MSSRNVTHYFPSRWSFFEVWTWLRGHGIDFSRCRIQFDGYFSAELQGSEQHERNKDPYASK